MQEQEISYIKKDIKKIIFLYALIAILIVALFIIEKQTEMISKSSKEIYKIILRH